LGGEKLKIPLFAMLVFGAWFFVHVPYAATQEITEGESLSEEIQIRDPRAGEENLTLDQNTSDTPAAERTVETSSIWSVVRMILVLALAAAAVYGVVFFIKRSSKRSPESSPFLKILATSHLASNRYVHIAAVGSKAWLIGSSEGGVALIGEIDDKDVINAMLLEDSRKAAESSASRFPDFQSILRRFGAGNPAASSDTGSSSADDIRRRRERLRGL
jgi:flagellar protein FliO/FliZ